MPAQWSCLWLVLDRKLSPCKIAYDDVTRPVFRQKSYPVRELEQPEVAHTMRLVEPYNAIPHVVLFRGGSDPQNPKKRILGPLFRPPWPLRSGTNRIFFRNKTCPKFSPIFADFQNPFVSHRDRVIAFYSEKVATVILAVVTKGEMTLLIGVRHYDFCRVDVTATWNGGRFKRRGASR